MTTRPGRIGWGWHYRAIDKDGNALYCREQQQDNGPWRNLSYTHRWAVLMADDIPDEARLEGWNDIFLTGIGTYGCKPEGPPATGHWTGWQPCPSCGRKYR